MKSLNRSLFYVLSAFLFISQAQALEWKGIFIAGDDSIENFDNGREDLTAAFSSLGSLSTIQLSSSRKYISQEKQVYPATANNINAAFGQLNVSAGEGCLIHMTSHGAQGQGFYLSMAGILSPQVLDSFINEACGDAPTVVLVSACYSGQFITEGIKGPNRIVMTAARGDRPSFGCSTETEYTYWDSCLLTELPNAATWVELYSKVNTCITQKESAIGVRPSEPQAYFGENTKDWTILH